MKRRSRTYWKELGEKLIKVYQRYTEVRVSGTKRQKSIWRNKILAIEEEARLQANKQYHSIRKLGIANHMGWWDSLESYIDRQNNLRLESSNVGKLLSPQDVDEAFETAKVAIKFLSSSTSTKSGIERALLKIRDEVYKDFELIGIEVLSDSELKSLGLDREDVNTGPINMDNSQFLEYWKWRQLNPVHEFFNYFPPSPPELRGSVGTMVVDLWNSSSLIRSQMRDYFNEFQRYLETKDDDWIDGITSGMLIERLDKLYAKIGKRRRH